LFLEHYLSVEVIGVLLLAAVVGAMQIATHRVEPASDGAVAA
jgi:NADH:ubiquinone oxidoreductase subunit 6 (subunit J)